MHPSSSSARSVVPEVEALEERCVLSTATYIAGLYNVFLHRNPDAPSASVLISAIDSALMTPQQVASFLVTTPEYRANLIQSDFQRLMGRPAGAVDISAGEAVMQAGLTETQYVDILLGSPEYFARHGGTPTSWTQAVYRDVLGRPADPVGLAAVTGEIQAGVPLATAALGILNSPESLARIVTADFETVLGRPPDAGFVAAGVAALQAGLRPEQLQALLAASPEFINAHGGLDPIIPRPVLVPVAVPVFTPFVEPVDTFFFDPFVAGLFDFGGCSCSGTAGGFSGSFGGFSGSGSF
jgi:hypothetical protein